MAKPRTDNDKIYFFVANFYSGQPRAYSVFQLSAAEKKLVRQFSIDAPGESPFSATGMAMELSADEKTMFLTIGTDDDADLGRFAALDLTTGKLTKFPTFSIPTHVKNMQVLDGRRILFGNHSDKHGPTIFDIDNGSSSEIMSSAELAKSIGYSYVYSPDGYDIYSSKVSLIEKSTKQDDGSFKTEPISVKANYVAGAMRRIFAFAKPN
jgi:hypothetical protein